MKKNYLLSLLAMAFAFYTANAQFTDNFETYPLGDYHGGNWSSWSGAAGGEDILVAPTYAFDGTKSGFIGGSTVQDAMLQLGNKTSGEWQLAFQVYIPAGKSGYMNFQGTTTATGGAGTDTATGMQGIFNSPNLVFNNVQSLSGNPGLGGAYLNVDDPTATYTWTYPEATWFPISINFNVDTVLWTMTINGTALPAQPFDAEAVVGGIDFFSFDANNEMYIDAIIYTDVLSVDDKSFNLFNAYPNPVKDYLNLTTQSKVDSVEVYDVLGQKVLTTMPSVVSPKIDMRNFASGAYFVKVTIANQSRTIKIIK